jgi:hypothetical protein
VLISPDKLLNERSRMINLLHDFKEVGKLPDKPFSLRDNTAREVIETMVEGISPWNLFLEKSMI